MKHSFALVTGTTSGLGYAAASMLATKGYRQVIVTGRSLAGVQKTAAQLAAETNKQIFTPLELDLDSPSSVQSALAELVKRGQPIDFLLLNAGMVPGKKRVITAAGFEASQAPLIGHHQLTVGLLRANLLSPNARIVIAGAEPARGGVPMFKYTDLPAFAAKYTQGDRTAAVEALIRNGPNVKYSPNNAYADAKLIIAWWVAALARRLPSGMAVYAVSPGASNATKVARNAGPLLKYREFSVMMRKDCWRSRPRAKKGGSSGWSTLREWINRNRIVNWVGVKSRMLAAVAYNHDWRHLYLRFRSGDVYCYRSVPVERYEELLAADSKGQYCRQHILNDYPYDRVPQAFPTAS